MINRTAVFPLALFVSLLLLLSSFALDTWPRFSGDVRSLYPPSSETRSGLESAQRYFGSAQTDVVLVDLSRAASYEDVAFLIDELLELDYLLRVTGPISRDSRFPLPLITPGGELGRVLIEIENAIDDDARAKLDSNIQTVLGGYPQLKPKRTGQFALTESVTRTVTNETLQKVPLAACVLLLLLSLLFRSPVFAAKLLFAPIFSFSWIMLLSALFGSSFGPISQLLPSFLLAVGTSYSVHVAARVLESESGKEDETIREVQTAILFAALTTALGALSLLFLGVQGVTEFAIPAAIGVFLCCFFSLTISVDFAYGRKAKVSPEGGRLKVFSFDPAFLIKPSFTVCLLLVAISLMPGINQLDFSIKLNSFLPSESIENQHLSEIEQAFPGNHFIDIVLKNGDTSVTKALPESVVLAVKDELLSLPEIITVVTPFDFALSEEFKNKTASLGVGSFITKDKSVVRFLVEVSSQGRQLVSLKQDILRQLGHDFSSGKYHFSISSVELLLAEQAERLLHGVMQSLAVTLIVISALLMVLFRNPFVVLIGLIPNILPVVTAFGVAGFFLGEVNIGTGVAGAIALAIAADDTFHILCCWSESLRKTGNAKMAAISAARTAFGAMLTTSIVLTSVFLVLGTSKVEPVRHYGLLIGGMLFLGLCADLVLVPYFLSKMKIDHEPA
jgi:hypothetical protein